MNLWQFRLFNFYRGENDMDLIYLPVELYKKKIDSRFRIVEAVVKRARALHNGAMPKIVSKSKKTTTVALEEIISDSVHVLSGEAAIKAKEEANKLRYEDMIDESKQKESFPEELTKFEKDLQGYLRDKEEK
jgi:DNA-directed RNA polymerase omega subunit